MGAAPTTTTSSGSSSRRTIGSTIRRRPSRRPIRLDGVVEQATQHVRRIPVGLGEEVRVHVAGGGGVVVAEAAGDRADVDPR